MAKTTPSPKPSSRNANRGWRIAVYVGTFLSVAAVFAILVLMFGQVRGVEFSPSDFQTRHFSLHEIPWLKIQISPIHRSTSQTPTARYLAAQSLIQPRRPAPVKGQGNSPTKSDPWHLVSVTRGGVTAPPADAKLLTDQLDAYTSSQGQSTLFWHDWSIREPAKAKVLWPVIQKLAMRELYILIPTVFSLAIDSKDDAELQQSIDRSLQKNYAELVAEMRGAGRNELAAELLSEALIDFPHDKNLQALR